MTATEINKIAIIGCGYVGSAVASFWQRSAHLLTVTTTTPTKVPELEKIAQRVIVIKADNLEGLKQVIAGQDIILLCVGPSRRGVPYLETYLETAQNLVTVLKETTPLPKQLIYTGSYAVLGDKQGAWADENASLDPSNENGEILCQTEAVLLSAASDRLKVCILRLAGIYGPGRELIKIFKHWAGKTFAGKGEDYSNWIHLDDIVAGIELARAEQLQGIYNLSGDRPLQTRQFLDKLFTTHHLPLITWDGSPTGKQSRNSRLDNQKIKAAGLKLIHPEIEF